MPGEARRARLWRQRVAQELLLKFPPPLPVSLRAHLLNLCMAFFCVCALSCAFMSTKWKELICDWLTIESTIWMYEGCIPALDVHFYSLFTCIMHICILHSLFLITFSLRQASYSCIHHMHNRVCRHSYTSSYFFFYICHHRWQEWYCTLTIVHKPNLHLLLKTIFSHLHFYYAR